MEPLGSPQGAHDAAAHLFGVPHRVEHVDAATAAALKVVCRLLCASSLLLQAAGWQRWCWLENRRWEGASLHLGSPPPHPTSSSSSSQTQTGRLQRSRRR